MGINRNEKQRHDGSYLHQLTSWHGRQPNERPFISSASVKSKPVPRSGNLPEGA